MALEQLLDIKQIEKKPFLLFIYALICAIFSLFISYFLFPEYASLLFVAFGTLLLIPVIVKTFEFEQMVDTIKNMNPFDNKNKQKITFSLFSFFSHAKKVLIVYGYVFVAFLIVFMISYIALPSSVSSELFKEQISSLSGFSDSKYIYQNNLLLNEICDTNPLFSIENTVTDCQVINLNHDGNFEYLIFENSTKPSRVYYTDIKQFGSYSLYVRTSLFWNNFFILIIIVLMSCLLGAGSLFALIFIASLLGVFFSDIIQKAIGIFTHAAPVAAVSTPYVALHGLFLCLAYIFAIISGGILSLSLISGKYKSKEFFVVLVQAIILFLVSVLFLFIGVMIRSVV
jgi:hypothetical protein